MVVDLLVLKFLVLLLKYLVYLVIMRPLLFGCVVNCWPGSWAPGSLFSLAQVFLHGLGTWGSPTHMPYYFQPRKQLSDEVEALDRQLQEEIVLNISV